MVPNWTIVWLNKLHMKPVGVFAYFNAGLDKWPPLDETCEEAELLAAWRTFAWTHPKRQVVLTFPPCTNKQHFPAVIVQLHRGCRCIHAAALQVRMCSLTSTRLSQRGRHLLKILARCFCMVTPGVLFSTFLCKPTKFGKAIHLPPGVNLWPAQRFSCDPPWLFGSLVEGLMVIYGEPCWMNWQNL